MNTEQKQFLVDVGFEKVGEWWTHPVLGQVHVGHPEKKFSYHYRRMLKWMGVHPDAPELVVEHAFRKARVSAQNRRRLLAGAGAVLTNAEVLEVEDRLAANLKRLRDIDRLMRQVPTGGQR